MQRHQRKKLEITIATAYIDRVAAILDRFEVKGFTVLQAMMGRGASGQWRDTGVTGADQHVVMTAIVGVDAAEKLLDELALFFAVHHGIVVVSDVAVMRGERF